MQVRRRERRGAGMRITHTDCGGEYEIIGQEYVDKDYPNVDVYRCKRCRKQTLQPDSPELDKVYTEMVGEE